MSREKRFQRKFSRKIKYLERESDERKIYREITYEKSIFLKKK